MNYSLKLLQIILKTKIRKTHRLMVSVIRVCVFSVIEEESNYCYEDQCGIYIPVIFHLC